jgi:hypothetical protein
MFKQIKLIHPLLADGMKFVDLKKYELERLTSEKESEKKRLQLG